VSSDDVLLAGGELDDKDVIAAVEVALDRDDA